MPVKHTFEDLKKKAAFAARYPAAQEIARMYPVGLVLEAAESYGFSDHKASSTRFLAIILRDYPDRFQEVCEEGHRERERLQNRTPSEHVREDLETLLKELGWVEESINDIATRDRRVLKAVLHETGSFNKAKQTLDDLKAKLESIEAYVAGD